jgi:hypothetical protein
MQEHPKLPKSGNRQIPAVVPGCLGAGPSAVDAPGLRHAAPLTHHSNRTGTGGRRLVRAGDDPQEVLEQPFACVRRRQASLKRRDLDFQIAYFRRSVLAYGEDGVERRRTRRPGTRRGVCDRVTHAVSGWLGQTRQRTGHLFRGDGARL